MGQTAKRVRCAAVEPWNVWSDDYSPLHNGSDDLGDCGGTQPPPLTFDFKAEYGMLGDLPPPLPASAWIFGQKTKCGCGCFNSKA